MDEMIERVARAALKSVTRTATGYTGDETDLSSVVVDCTVDFLALARAAIAAMREPTHAMFLAMERSGICFQSQVRGWPAAIDAALEDTCKRLSQGDR